MRWLGCAAVFLAFGCSGSEESSTASGLCDESTAVAPGYGRCGATDVLHRASVEACESLLPRDETFGDGADGGCTRDSECTEAPRGYCGSTGMGPLTCVYGCMRDEDCSGGRICLCGDPIGRCVRGDCASDVECGPGLSCRSYRDADECGNAAFACQTPEDECGADADCPAGAGCTHVNGRFSCARIERCVF